MTEAESKPTSELNRNQIDILQHTAHRAAGGLYCGGEPDIDKLVEAGLMEYAGKKSFVPDSYYRITAKGREALTNANPRRNIPVIIPRDGRRA